MFAMVVQVDEKGCLSREEFETLDALRAKFSMDGFSPDAPPARPELRGQPCFVGLVGPMYGGPECPLRYETPAAYETLSA